MNSIETSKIPQINKSHVSLGDSAPADQGTKPSPRVDGSKVQTGAAAAVYQKAGATPKASGAANVSISPRARELSLAKRAAESVPEGHEEKLNNLRALIASGEYRSDAGQIADGIAREAVRDELAKDPDALLSL